ncbi:hypothetical protein DRO32_03715 [Candidatus Bathyarchaeota archaeon]|nr:MAG: hypothetical protein DRO32_03715 [Candidatus Bathyarchaeota archaeon]
MELLDLANRGWAMRYLREARAELKLASEEPGLSILFSIEAARKAQASIYHCLGDARALESLVFTAMVEEEAPSDKVMEMLITVEKMVQAVSRTEDPKEAYKLASGVVELASRVLSKVIGECGG